MGRGPRYRMRLLVDILKDLPMAVISVANPKGGSGKTTLTLVLAAQFASQNASVAVIDADPNAFIANSD